MRRDITSGGMDGIEAAGSLDADLLRRIERREARVVVVGLGYVGLTLAEALVSAGYSVTGHDIGAARVAAINAGRSPITHLGDSALTAMHAAGFRASADPDCLAEADVATICVPTPLDAQRTPDLSAVSAAAAAVVARLRPGGLVLMESTLHPHGSEEILTPLIAARGLVPGRDIFVAFSPERENPGDAGRRGTAIPRVVGANDPASRRLAAAFYAAAGYTVHTVSSAATAEAVKLVENSFRLVNIALANEFKTVFRGMGIDVHEVIAAASTKPFGFMPFHPGPGAGGHCIPVDPLYLAWQARRLGLETPLIALSAALNETMPGRVAEEVLALLAERRGKEARGARLLVLGLAYKRNVEDLRESPAVTLLHRLAAAGAETWWHDPWVREWPTELDARRLDRLDAAQLAGFDAAVIATDHDGPDYGLVLRHVGLVADARGAARRLGLDCARVVQV